MDVTVSGDQAGERLDRVLAAALDDLSRSRLKALIEEGQVSQDGKVVRSPSAKVGAGDAFEITIPAPVDAIPVGQDIPLDILYEDDDLIVLDKPAGMVVHPAPGNPDGTLVNALIYHCGDSLAGIGGVRRPGIVHRLDKDTSGVMVAAKTAVAHANLVEQFSARSVDRAYHAIVWGLPKPAAGEIEGAIGRHPKNRKKMAVRDTGGKHALTRYKTLKVYGDGLASLVECRLATGRTHQIRVHLSHRGNPLVGDPVYGRSTGRRDAVSALDPDIKRQIGDFSRQALHARVLGFAHPTTGQHVDFKTELPDDMAHLKQILESL
ncbi:MAG: RluA family pseudouridine synthase [Rhodospirillaceae bacterium]|nr:RluA family pseudouridine synthase [Rhodospirillaceae bacterium]MBT5944527.1 RluA family pseudouridine synthase [Rhodospirillaceae bacterium]MBT6405956.1 RluA family pseudouridine synthase [Rhodospirillaceae bacterium]MBT6535894.1 RluA family pseudouridine synthase [Rhodospirillaceae bacterium]MBT7361575.1 RluA family pseudouridine synthase [Rhodospirillaceae bacterium]